MKRKILLSTRAYKVMTNEVGYSDIEETGGVLLGYLHKNKIYVIEAIDGGPQKVASKSSFCFDREYVQHVSNKISNLYNPPLVLVGIWHKHNSFHEHPFSEDDENMHKETCSLVKGSVASILFQYIENGKYIMNTYWVEENTISEKVEFVLKKDCARLIKTIYRAKYIKASLVRRMF